MKFDAQFTVSFEFKDDPEGLYSDRYRESVMASIHEFVEDMRAWLQKQPIVEACKCDITKTLKP